MLGLKDVVEGKREPKLASTATAIDAVETVCLEVRRLAAEYARVPESVRTLVKSLFVATGTIMKTYEADSGRRRRVLGRSSGEIEALITADER